MDAPGMEVCKAVVAVALIGGDGKGPHHRKLSLREVTINVLATNDEDRIPGFEGEGDVTLEVIHLLGVQHVEAEFLRDHIIGDFKLVETLPN